MNVMELSGYVSCTDINLLYYQYGLNNEFIDELINEVNDYSQKNDLDINLVKNVYSSITTAESYSETLGYLFSTESTKYDLIFVDIVESKNIVKYFSDLSQYLPQSLLEKYSNGIVKETNYFNDKMVTLVNNNSNNSIKLS